MQTPVPSDVLLVAVAYNHEEIGSQSTAGADSTMLRDFLDALVPSLLAKDVHASNAKDASNAVDSVETRKCMLRDMYHRSFVLSCDAAHAVHPNYADKHQAQHKPYMGEGVVIKVNANQRYATTPASLGFARYVAHQSSKCLQEMVVRNDSPCGSTVGPMTAASTGIDTLDCGVPLWAMHSIREICAWKDIEHLIEFGADVVKHISARV